MRLMPSDEALSLFEELGQIVALLEADLPEGRCCYRLQH